MLRKEILSARLPVTLNYMPMVRQTDKNCLHGEKSSYLIEISPKWDESILI